MDGAGSEPSVIRRLVDVVERLASEFEPRTGLPMIIAEVQRAREDLRTMVLDECDHLDVVEARAHQALIELTAPLEGIPWPRAILARERL